MKMRAVIAAVVAAAFAAGLLSSAPARAGTITIEVCHDASRTGREWRGVDCGTEFEAGVPWILYILQIGSMIVTLRSVPVDANLVLYEAEVRTPSGGKVVLRREALVVIPSGSSVPPGRGGGGGRR